MEGIQSFGSGTGIRRLITYGLVTAGLLAMAAGLWKAHEAGFDALAHLPTRDATVASIDVSALRRAGVLKLLASKPGTEEAEYANFVRGTGFDYQRDLDQLSAAFGPSGTYFIVRGRFDWPRLEAYAKANGGACYEKLCHLPGSVPERRISFLPLQANIMALAVSTDDLAAARMRESERPAGFGFQDPVWISIPASALQRTSSMLPGLRIFAATVVGADRVNLTLGPVSNGNYAARLEALCNSPQTAKTIAAQLTQVNTALKSTATFRQADLKVFGYWPIPKDTIQNLAAGL